MATPDNVLDRVLVTGATGFIGAAVVDALVAAGAHVFAVGHRQPIDARHPDQVTAVTADLTVEDEVHRVVELARPTVAFHLAWVGEPGSYLASVPWNSSSVRFSLSLLERLLEAGCHRLVFAGSCAEYQLGPQLLREDSPTIPSSVYGAAKLALGTLAAPAAAVSGASLAWARIFYVHGPGEDPRRAVPQLVAGARRGEPPALNKPQQERDFLHVQDVAAALLALARASAHGTFNVCSGQGTALTALWEQVLAMMGLQAPGLPLSEGTGSEPPIVGDPARLRSLGWAPRFGPEEALAETVRWWSDPLPHR